MRDDLSRAELESRVLDIVGELLDVPEAQREAELMRRCGSGPLAERVQAVLAAGASIGDFMERSPVVVVDEVIAPRRGLAEGTRIGAYRVVSLIGSGAMGDVYAAEPAAGGRPVALKVVRPGAVTRQLRRRFEFEVAALARLSHSNIARLLGSGMYAGEDGDRPFLVMELVSGSNLVEHAEARSLGIADRVDLFLKVCDAVGHAHRAGLIHRDLKPDNILVDSASGEPKVLDFGVARVLDPEGTLSSVTGEHVVGSAPYMSPEQAGGGSGEPVDTRADVYSLGAILYELLGGRPAHRPSGRSLADFMRAVRDEDPPRLGVIAPACRGDLDVIVHAAMARDPRQRYQSVEALAGDLRRYREGDPLSVRPPGTLYLLWKVASRHRTTVALGLLATVMLVAAVAFGGVQLARAQRAERQKETMLRQVIEASQTLVVSVNKAMREQKQPLEARLIVLGQATDFLEQVQSEVGDDPRIFIELMRSYTRLGQVIGGAGDSSLGLNQRAKDLFVRAAGIGSRLLSRSDSGEVRRLMADALEEQALLEQGAASVSLFRASADHIAAAARLAERPDQARLDARRELQLRLRAATTDRDIGEVQQVVGSLVNLSARYANDAELWSERGLAERMLGELLLETDCPRALAALEASEESFGRTIRLGQDDFTNNRHVAKVRVAKVRCLAGQRPAGELLSMLDEGLSQSARASELAGPGSLGRRSHLEIVMSVLHRGIEVTNATVASAGSPDAKAIALRVLEVTRDDLAAMRARPTDAAGFPTEQGLTAEIEAAAARLEQLAGAR